MKTNNLKPSSASAKQKKPEGGPAVLHPTHDNIAYTPQLNKKETAEQQEEENKADEMDR